MIEAANANEFLEMETKTEDNRVSKRIEILLNSYIQRMKKDQDC